jgi:hypothetical protein
MEDNYLALKSEGKSENEAIGSVIAEFGNIDELIAELGLTPQGQAEPDRIVDAVEAKAYLQAVRQAAIQIAIGIPLFILAAASLILFGQLADAGLIGGQYSQSVRQSLALVPLFVLVAAGVSLLIYSGVRLERYKYLDGAFSLPEAVKTQVIREKEAFIPTYTLGVMIGVSLCILSPLAIFLASLLGEDRAGYGVPVLLLMVAIAVFFFVYFGTIKEAFNRLLKLEAFADPARQEKDKVIGVVASIVWPLSAAVFLLLGFLFHAWGIAWIIFPIVGILFGIFAAVYSVLKRS